jgi:AcrR family transcriptional regulator
MGTTEEKIILATIDCIEKYGLENTTIRRIGTEAGMNSASINYYFRSKDTLMQQVIETALGNAFDMDNFQHSVGLPAKERLIIVMDGMLAGALQYPGLTKAFFSELLLANKHSSPMSQRCNIFLDVLKKELADAYPERSVEEIGTAIMGIASATFLFPGLFPNFFTIFPQLDLTDDRQRRDYVHYIVECYFKE